jgi:hypothetical protein
MVSPCSGRDSAEGRLIDISRSSIRHGSPHSVQTTNAFPSIQSESRLSPSANVSRFPLPTLRSSMLSGSERICCKWRRVSEDGGDGRPGGRYAVVCKPRRGPLRLPYLQQNRFAGLAAAFAPTRKGEPDRTREFGPFVAGGAWERVPSGSKSRTRVASDPTFRRPARRSLSKYSGAQGNHSRLTSFGFLSSRSAIYLLCRT